MFNNYRANKGYERREEIMSKMSDANQMEFDNLIKKYQEQPDTLIKEYDDMIISSLFGIIANFRANDVLREDFITNVDILIRNREFISNQYCNNRRSND